MAEISVDETGVYLRAHPDRLVALLSPEGEVLDGRPGWAAPRLWRELVEGRATLCRPSRAVSFYAAVEVPSSWKERRALTSFESRIVTRSAQGVTGKVLAHETGVSCSRVSDALRTAAGKLGLRTSSELLRVAAGLGIEHPPRIDRRVFTEAEREVVDLVRSGLSNRAIAELRGRSPRTVANQVASVLRKATCPSRRALIAMRVHGA